MAEYKAKKAMATYLGLIEALDIYVYDWQREMLFKFIKAPPNNA